MYTGNHNIELDRPFKDIHYLYYLTLRVTNMDEITQEQRDVKLKLDREWMKLKNALAMEYDGVYTMEELDMETMRANVKAFHQELVELNYPLTRLK